jgi:hypothetical protein
MNQRVIENDEEEPPRPQKASSTPQKSKIKEVVKEEENGKEAKQSLEEYNKSIEALNDKLFVKVDDICISDELVENSSDNIKPEEFEEDKDGDQNGYKILEESGSEGMLQETRSEESKEDHNKLEKEELKLEEETKISKRNSQKSNENRSKMKTKLDIDAEVGSNKDKNMKFEEIKETKMVKKRFDSEPDQEFLPQENVETETREGFIVNENFGTDFAERGGNKKLSYNSEAKSTRSEDKNEEKIKYVNSTNPTSETSSFQDSSVTSNYDGKFINSESKKKGSKNLEGGS